MSTIQKKINEVNLEKQRIPFICFLVWKTHIEMDGISLPFLVFGTQGSEIDLFVVLASLAIVPIFIRKRKKK